MEVQKPRETVKPKPSSSSSRGRGERLARSHRGLTCGNCRARKVNTQFALTLNFLSWGYLPSILKYPDSVCQTRCDGTQPSCKTCDVYHDECRYEKPPPMSQIVAMAKRLQEAEQTIEQLRSALKLQPEITSTGGPATEATVSDSGHQKPSIITLALPPPPFSVSSTLPVALPERRASSIVPSKSPAKESPSEELLSDLSLDENGRVRCHSTSTAPERGCPIMLTSKVDLLLRTDFRCS